MSDRVVEHQAGFHLPDGRLASLRPLSAADAGAVFTLYRNLSDHDRYFRFLTLNPVGLDQLVSKLIEPGKRQYAVGAFDDERLIGVANVLSDLGWPRRRLHSGSVRRLEIELPEAPLAANEVAEASGAKCLMPQ